MTVRAQMRGHPVYHDGTVWRHTDDHSLAPASGGVERPCTHCGLIAEAGYGPDPCLGWGDGPACCGHGQVKRRLRHPMTRRAQTRSVRRFHASRPRHPVLVTLALVAVAAALLAGLFWIGVL